MLNGVKHYALTFSPKYDVEYIRSFYICIHLFIFRKVVEGT